MIVVAQVSSSSSLLSSSSRRRSTTDALCCCCHDGRMNDTNNNNSSLPPPLVVPALPPRCCSSSILIDIDIDDYYAVGRCRCRRRRRQRGGGGGVQRLLTRQQQKQQSFFFTRSSTRGGQKQQQKRKQKQKGGSSSILLLLQLLVFSSSSSSLLFLMLYSWNVVVVMAATTATTTANNDGGNSGGSGSLLIDGFGGGVYTTIPEHHDVDDDDDIIKKKKKKKKKRITRTKSNNNNNRRKNKNAAATVGRDDEMTPNNDSSDSNNLKKKSKKKKRNDIICSPRDKPLRPIDLPNVQYFGDDDDTTTTNKKNDDDKGRYQPIVLDETGKTVYVTDGSVPQLGISSSSSSSSSLSYSSSRGTTSSNKNSTTTTTTTATSTTIEAATVTLDGNSVLRNEEEENENEKVTSSSSSIWDDDDENNVVIANNDDNEMDGVVLSNFSLLHGVMERNDVQSILDLLYDSISNEDIVLDSDPDTVDGMPTYEIFIDSIEIRQDKPDERGTTKIDDSNPITWARRKVLRNQLQKIMKPILDEKITPYVNQRFPEICQKYKNKNTKKKKKNNNNNDKSSSNNDNEHNDDDDDDDDEEEEEEEERTCTPCYSLIRHYRDNERLSHATHHDGHAIATVVVSLSDVYDEYNGGLYVANSDSQRIYIPLKRGDAAVHKSDLLHGVKVLPTTTNHNNNNNNKKTNTNTNNTSSSSSSSSSANSSSVRWSWILWYRDSTTCHDHGEEWFYECATIDNNPTCQMLLATKLGNLGQEEVLKWNMIAAQGGQGRACIKIARAYLGLLPSSLSYNRQKAIEYYQLGIDSCNEPDAHYGMASILIQQLSEKFDKAKKKYKNNGPKLANVAKSISHGTEMIQAIAHLEQAAITGHVYAMFNLGIVHLYGYGHFQRNPQLAGDWFEICSLPECLFLKAMQVSSLGEDELAEDWKRRALRLGYGQPWRKMARDMTGSGGAGGVDLNIKWPPTYEGNIPSEV